MDEVKYIRGLADDDITPEQLQTQLELAEEENSWEEFKPEAPNNTWECVMAIIDDAITNGFEFKFADGKLWFREVI